MITSPDYQGRAEHIHPTARTSGVKIGGASPSTVTQGPPYRYGASRLELRPRVAMLLKRERAR